MNEFLFITSMVAAFGCVALIARFFGKAGLSVWISVALIAANIIVTKQITMFGIDCTLANVMFASTFLCTDIISECYGKKESKKAVNLGLLCAIGFIAVIQVSLRFIPNEFDYVQESMEILFEFSSRAMIASVGCCYLANMCDVYLFEKLKNRFPNHLWFRNNVCTIVCNGLENFLFTIAAFCGVFYNLKECIMIGIATTLIEAIIAVCDTPFVYLGKYACKKYIATEDCKGGECDAKEDESELSGEFETE